MSEEQQAEQVDNNPHGNKDVYEIESVTESSNETVNEPEGNPAMEKAMKGGWAPKEQWKGDPNSWVDYNEFNYRGELMSHIKRSNDQVAELRNELNISQTALEKLGKLHARTLAKEKEDIVQTLEQQKVEAINENRGEDVVDIEKKMEKVNAEFAEMEKEEETPSTENVDPYDGWPQEAKEWAVKNQDWYGKDQYLTQKADLLAQQYLIDQYHETGVQPSHLEVLTHVENALGKGTQQTQQSQRQQSQQEIEPDSNAQAVTSNQKNNGKTYTIEQLPPETQAVVRQMAAVSDMPIQDYINDLAAAGELDI